MSGSLAAWQAMPRAAQIRAAAVAVLQNYPTLAGPRVYDTPLDPFDQSSALPAVGVTSEESRALRSLAGGPANFALTVNLSLQLMVAGAVAADAVAQLDALEAQAMEALMGDPVFPSLYQRADSVEMVRRFGTQGERLIGECMVKFALLVGSENYSPPRATTPLQPNGQPIGILHDFRTVIEPLTAIEVTVAAGGAAATYGTAAGSMLVSVGLPDHGLVVGDSYTVAAAVNVGGLVLSGVYVVTSVTDDNDFAFEAASSATSSAEIQVPVQLQPEILITLPQ